MNFDISKLLAVIKDPDLKLKIDELYGENITLREEVFQLKRQLEEIKRTEEVEKNLLHKDNHYFLKKGEEEDGPYCTKCWDADRKLIRLHSGNVNNGLHYFDCPNCKTVTNTGTYIARPVRSAEDYG